MTNRRPGTDWNAWTISMLPVLAVSVFALATAIIVFAILGLT